MLNKFIEKYFGNFFVWVLVGMIFGGYVVFEYVSVGWFLFFAVIFFALAVFTFSEMESEIKQLADQKVNEANLEKEEIKLQKEAFERSAAIWKQSLLERTAGFPSLIDFIAQFEELQDEYVAGTLLQKRHPAPKAAEAVKEEAKRRREAERQLKQIKAIIEHYEQIAPFLLDYKDEVIEDDVIAYGDFDEFEKQDPARYFLTKEEYRKLPTVERNQMALDRFKKRKWQKWLIGRMYERYIGYQYEIKGYQVTYHGIEEGLEDRGIDLICKKDKETILIQCKNWSHFKNIYENEIFQFFGTSYRYKWANKDEKVSTIFYTTTTVTEVAKGFARELGLKIKEGVKYDQDYPMIKCNISGRTKERIYHLPFDQQYDKIVIETAKGETFCQTVKEAEDAGYRRAFKWRGKKE